jgi:hypothetical protein
MAAKVGSKRTRLEINRDRRQTAEWYLKGWTQQQIADAISDDPERHYTLSRVQISNDLAAIRKDWQASAVRNFDEAQAQELAKVDLLELEYWQAWERSCQDAETRTRKQRLADEGEVKEITKVTKGQAGDKRFLDGVQWCIERRCKILGLDAPQKIAPTDPTGKESWAGDVIRVVVHE